LPFKENKSLRWSALGIAIGMTAVFFGYLVVEVDLFLLLSIDVVEVK